MRPVERFCKNRCCQRQDDEQVFHCGLRVIG
jgi:hypothetical protein